MSEKVELIKVDGMFCRNCETRISKALAELPGVKKVEADYTNGKVEVTVNTEQVNRSALEDCITNLGYDPVTPRGSYLVIPAILLCVLLFYSVASFLGWTKVFNIFPTIDTTMSLGAVFLIGILTSVHCIAMCGGINLTQATLAAKANAPLLKSNVGYNLGRIFSYTAVGGIVGGIGSIFSLSAMGKSIVTLLVGALMILMALNFLGVFKLLRRVNIGIPKGIYDTLYDKFGRKSSFMLGVLNGFMPCGPLQSMQIYALSTGSALVGALSMFLFSLGTVPLMIGFGMISGKLTRKYQKYMLAVSAIIVFIMGLHMIDNGLALSGINRGSNVGSINTNIAVIDDNIQYVRTEVDYNDYPAITVKEGVPVHWTIVVPEGKLTGCNREIVVPEYDLDILLKEGENELSFTPYTEGQYGFSCWMGMIKSTINVLSDDEYKSIAPDPSSVEAYLPNNEEEKTDRWDKRKKILSDTPEIDIDFTYINMDDSINETYGMMTEPEKYEGKRIRVNGAYTVEEKNGGIKHFCGIYNPASCCAIGVLEFLPTEEMVDLKKYLNSDEMITITGNLEIYHEDDGKHIRLKDCRLDK